MGRRRNRLRRVRAALITAREELRDHLVPDEIPLDNLVPY